MLAGLSSVAPLACQLHEDGAMSLSTVPPRSGTAPGTDWALDDQVLREQITRVVPKNLLEFFGFWFFSKFTCLVFAPSGSGLGSLGI